MYIRAFAAAVVFVVLAATGPASEALNDPAGASPAAVGAAAVPGAPPKPFDKYDVIQMAQWDFLYGKETDWEEGIRYLQQMCKEELDPAVAQWRDEKWRDNVCGRLCNTLEQVFASGRYDLCDRAASYGVFLGSSQLPWLEKFMEMRIQCMIKLGKAADALPLAKSYYNVCSMSKTSAAIDLICVCLIEDKKNPDAAGTVRKFRMQQVKGATAPSNADSTQPKAKSVLDDIKVDAGEYLKTVQQLETRGEAYTRLIDRGNLLLLADQPAGAKAIFNKAYALASEKQLPEASESVARAMRAEDGTVGRANAWILAQRASADAK